MICIWISIICFILSSMLYFTAQKYLSHIYPLSVFFDAAGPTESLLWRQSRTVLAARLLALISILVAIHDTVLPALSGFDWAPILPEKYIGYVPLGTLLLGLLFEYLRTLTHGSIKDDKSSG